MHEMTVSERKLATAGSSGSFTELPWFPFLPLVSISPFETLLQNLTPVVENLISRLSLLIANLYHFVLVPALIFIMKDFSSPLVFTCQ